MAWALLTPSSGRSQRRDILHDLGQLSLGMPKVIGLLSSQPELGAISEQLTQPDRNGRRNGLALADDVIEGLPRDPEEARDLGLALTGGGYRNLGATRRRAA
jgi:hypothetical protein